MNKRRKQGLVLLALSVPLMWWGFNQFIYGSGHSTLEAIAVSLSCTGGLTCFFGGLYLLFTKDRGVVLASQANVGDSLVENLSTADKIRQRNQAAVDNLVTKTTDNAIKTLTKKQKVKPMAKANTSVELMKREKELETRRKELESLLAEVTKEEKAVEKELKSKGWMQQKDGSWSYE